jgi:hypothetical protein
MKIASPGRFPNVSCAIMVPSKGQQEISARDRRRAEQIQKTLTVETRIPADRLSIKPGKDVGNAILLEILTGELP